MSAINLSKGQPPINLGKSPAMTITMEWPAATDYDLYAVLLLWDGTNIHVGTFQAQGVTTVHSWAGVAHSGDVARSSGAQMAREVLTIGNLGPDVSAIVPVAYSAQSNGTGSFRRYGVSMTVDNGLGDAVRIDASNASDNDRVYSCCPAVVYNLGDALRVDPVELYSSPSREHRPRVLHSTSGVQVLMDAGPRNAYK
jgi:tellurite resistance protein TerA